MYVFQTNDALAEDSAVESTAMQGPEAAAKIMMGEIAQRWITEALANHSDVQYTLQEFDKSVHVRANGQLAFVVEMYPITNIINVPDSPALRVH